MEFRHSIKAVARQTGLKAPLIRMWERRYGAVVPKRTPTGRRIYSESDVRRLRMLKQATDAGESIGQVAGLSDEDLVRLAGEPGVNRVAGIDRDDNEAGVFLEASLAAITSLDTAMLETTLLAASSRLGKQVFLRKVLAPLLETAGERWSNGQMRVAHEHLLTATVRSILGSVIVTQHSNSKGPTILFTTLPGQYHELGLLMASVMASSIGWNAIYLGPNIPAEDIAAAAADKDARAIALSIIYPVDDPRLPLELAKLKRLLGENIQLIVGGRGTNSYGQILSELGVTPVAELENFTAVLSRLRDEPKAQSGGPLT